MISYDNFYSCTFGVFKACKTPFRKPSYISYDRWGYVSSKYWFGEDKKGSYVIRFSDHWSGLQCTNIASCRWFLKGKTVKKEQAGKIYLSQLVAVR